jgi:hypothetical protein
MDLHLNIGCKWRCDQMCKTFMKFRICEGDCVDKSILQAAECSTGGVSLLKITDYDQINRSKNVPNKNYFLFFSTDSTCNLYLLYSLNIQLRLAEHFYF